MSARFRIRINISDSASTYMCSITLVDTCCSSNKCFIVMHMPNSQILHVICHKCSIRIFCPLNKHGIFTNWGCRRGDGISIRQTFLLINISGLRILEHDCILLGFHLIEWPNLHVRHCSGRHTINNAIAINIPTNPLICTYSII